MSLDRTLENLDSWARRGNAWATRVARQKTAEALEAHQHHPIVHRTGPTPARRPRRRRN